MCGTWIPAFAGKTKKSRGRQKRAREDKEEPGTTKKSRGRQRRAGEDKKEPGKTKKNRGRQRRAGEDKEEPGKTEKSGGRQKKDYNIKKILDNLVIVIYYHRNKQCFRMATMIARL
jgi:hypothetical protein